MKALVYTEPYHFEYTDFSDPVAGADEVLIRVKACGICGSDVQGATGKTGRRIPPLIMGHEAAGVVEGVGRNVKVFGRGDRVCFDSTVYCNRCGPCRQGQYNRCCKREVLGVSTGNFKRHGAFAEYVAVPWWIVAKIPDNMSFVEAVFLEPLSIGMHAANRAPISCDDTILVIGAGTIGLFILQAVRVKGAKRIVVCDVNRFRLDVAAKLGADVVIEPTGKDLIKTMLEQTQNRGADVSFEAVGYAKTFQSAVAATKTGGYVVAVGNVEKHVEIDLQQLVAREHTFVGSYASSGEFRQGIDLISSGKINVRPLISDVVPLGDGAKAFERLLKVEENLLKIILEP